MSTFPDLLIADAPAHRYAKSLLPADWWTQVQIEADQERRHGLLDDLYEGDD